MTQPSPTPGSFPPPPSSGATASGTQPSAANAQGSSRSERPSIGALVASVTAQFSSIIRDEIELNKAKLRSFLGKMGRGGALLAVAGVLALFLLGWVLHTIEVALSLILPAWASSLIVVALLLLLVLVLVGLGVRSLRSAQDDVPDPSASIESTKDAISKGLGQ